MATLPQPRPTVIDLAREIKTQYPGQFDDLPDWELGTEIKAQYPGHFGDFDDAFSQSPQMREAGRIPTPQEVSRQIPIPVEEPPHPDELFGLTSAITPQQQIAAKDRGLAPTRDEGPSLPPELAELVGPPESAMTRRELVGPPEPVSPERFLPEIGQGIGGAPNIPRFRDPAARAAFQEASAVGPKAQQLREYVRGISPAALLPEPSTEYKGPITRYQMRPGGDFGQKPMSPEADAFARTILEVINPETVATIYALGGADKFVRAAAAHPRVMGWLKNAPVAREALRGLAEILVPGGITAYAGAQTKDAIEKAIAAYDEGDTEAGASHVASALVSGLATAGGAVGTGLRVRGAGRGQAASGSQEVATEALPAEGGPRPSLTPPRPSLTPPRGAEVPTPEELIGLAEPPAPASPAPRPSAPSTAGSSATGGRPIEIKPTGRSMVADLGYNQNLRFEEVQARLPQGASIDRGPMGQIVVEFPGRYSRPQIEAALRTALEGQPAPPKTVLDDILGAMGARAGEVAPAKQTRPAAPKVTPQPKPAQTAGPRTQAQMEPTRKAESVLEQEPPAERSPLEEIVAATETRAAIPRPPGDTHVTTGKTTRVSMGPMSEANREALADRLAGRADVSEDDGRTIVEFDSYVDADTASLAVNEALAGPREPEAPPAEQGPPLPTELVAAEPEPPSIEDLIAALPEPEPAPLAEEVPTPDELVGQPEASGAPPVPAVEQKPGIGIAAAFQDMGGSISENLRNTLWSKVQAGKTTEAGQPSRILKIAKAIRDRGGLQTREQFDDFAQHYGMDPQKLIERYSPKPQPRDVLDILAEPVEEPPSPEDLLPSLETQPEPAVPLPGFEPQQPETVSGKTAGFKDPDYVSKAQRFGEAYREARDQLPDSPLSWQEMTRLADEAFGGSIASGAYSSRDAYDALEWAEQQRLAEKFGKRVESPGEVKSTLHEITKAGDLMPSQTARTREQVQFQQFSTPPPHSYVMNWLADVGPSDRVLEPSAGTGSQAVWAKARGAQVHVNEISDRRADLLRTIGFDNVTQHDAEQLNNILQGHERPTVVVMNPPFSAAGQRGTKKDIQIGARHVEQALKRLAPGGRLVALVGRGMEFGKPAFEDWWDRILKEHNVRANVSLSGKLYSKYGTAFDNQLLVIDKTGPTSDAAEIVTGQFDSLEEAVDALSKVQATRAELLGATVPDRRGDRRPGRPGVSRPGSRKPQAGGLPERAGDLADLLPIPSGEPAGEPGLQGHESIPTPDELVGPGEPEAARPEHGRAGPAERREGADTRPERAPAGRLAEAEKPSAPSAGAPPETKPSKLDEEHQREDGPVFTEYQPHPDTKGFSKHPGTLVESKSMAAVERPAIRYQHSIPDSILKRGKGTVISAVQAETVMLAGQRHEQRLPDGRRAGFLLGDGTGVGKGRTLAAIALDNWEKGRRRMAFLSVSKDLMEDFLRDLRDVAGKDHPLTKSLTDLGDVQGKAIELPEGIVFSTYSTFISEKKKEKVKRYDQVKDWLGSEPLILFDEGHAAKNAGETGEEEDSKKGSQRAAAVIKLQDDIPQARIVYSSATGATEVENMAYMTRMGIWGQGTSFPGGFASFASAMNEGGVGAMEMIARDLKALGAYVARTISFEGVEYDELIHQTTPEQRKMYDSAAKIWQELFQNTEKALKDTKASGRGKAFARSRFYSAQQRFFKALITSFKIPTMLKEVEKAIEREGQAVISLIGTGESATEDIVNEAIAEGADLNDLDFTPKQAVIHYLNTAFPVEQFEDAEEETEDGRIRKVRRKVLDADGNPVLNAEAVELRDRMIDLLDDIKIPMNPLDQLMMGFEKKYPGKVAELTGRSKRLVTKENKFGAESIDYVRRKKDDKAAKSVNISEMRLFQSGEKRIAIISDAASTGISLHSDLRSKSQRKRTHFILELGWSADKQMQNFGRTHRSNQASPPRYVLVSSDIGGEKRFSSTIAKRLASLGALTKGQRDATGSGDLSKYNFESQYGTAAVDSLYGHLERGDKIPGVDDPVQLLVDMGLVPKDKKGERVRDEWRKGTKAVTTFLNRVMALEFNRQNAVFQAFMALFEKAVENAKASGEFDDGVMDLKARSIKVLESNPIHRDQLTGAPTYHVKIQAEEKTQPVLWRDVSEMFTAKEGEFWRNRKTGKWAFLKQAGHRMDETTGRVLNTYSVWTPAAARNSYLKEDELREHWERGGDIITGEKSDVAREVKKWWTEALEEIPEYRTVNYNIIAGLITPLWRELRESRAQKLKVMRVTADNGERVVGIEVPPRQVAKILTQLGVFQQPQNPKQVFEHVLSGGSVDLRDRLRLARRKFRGSDAIEVLNATSPQFRYLRTIGAIEEITEFKPRFFIPTNPAKGVEVLDSLLKQYPQMTQEKGAPETGSGTTLYGGLAGLPDMIRVAGRVTSKDAERLIEFANARGLIDTAKGAGDVIGGGAGDTWNQFFAFGTGKGKTDIGRASKLWHTPRMIGERYPEFLPIFNRAMAFEHERQELAERWTRMMRPYFDFDSADPRTRHKLDNRLIHGRYTRTDEIDWKGFDEKQQDAAEPAADAVRATMHDIFGHYEDLAVYKASGGRLTDASTITNRDEALKAVEAAGLTGEIAQSQADQLWEVLESLRKMKVEGYVPFSRFGKWTYGIRDRKEPRNNIWESRTNPFAARKRYRELRRIHKRKLADPSRYEFIEPFESTKREAMEGLLEGFGGFDLSILILLAKLDPEYHEATIEDRIDETAALLEQARMPEAEARAKAAEHEKKRQRQQDEGRRVPSFGEAVAQLQAEIKKAGFRAHFTPAQEVRGFEGDLPRPFADYILGAATHIAKQRFLQDVKRLMKRIPKTKGRLHRYAQNYIKYLASPPEELGWVKAMMFHFYLGNISPIPPFISPNVRAPLVNLTQVPMMAYPYLAQYGRDTQVAKELLRAYKDMGKAVGLTQREGRPVIVDFNKLPGDVREDVLKSLHDGVLKSQVMDELGGIARAKSKLVRRGLTFSGFFFSASEEVNRVVTFIAAHRLYRANIATAKPVARRKGESLRHGAFLSEFGSPLEFAEDVTNKTMLEYSRYNRPEIMRGRKSVLFVFKSFVIGNLELQQRLLNSWVDANETALTGGPPRGGRPPRTPGGPPETPSGTGGGGGDSGGPRLPGEPFDPIAPGGPRPKPWWKKTAFARSLLVTAFGGGAYGLWYMREFIEAANFVWKHTHHGEVLDLETVGRDWLQEHTGRQIANVILYGATNAFEWSPNLHYSLSMGEPIGAGRFLNSRELGDLAPVFAFPGRVSGPALELLGGGETWAENLNRALIAFGGSGMLPAAARTAERAEKGLRDRAGRRLELPGGREDFTLPELIEMTFGLEPTVVAEARRHERSISLADVAKAGPKSYFVRRLVDALEREDEAAFTRIVNEEIPKWNTDRMLWVGPGMRVGPRREGTYREIKAVMAQLGKLPKPLRESVDITWDDLARVLRERQREAEERQLRGVRRSVRPYVEQLQESYRGAEVPTPEELIGVAP